LRRLGPAEFALTTDAGVSDDAMNIWNATGRVLPVARPLDWTCTAPSVQLTWRLGEATMKALKISLVVAMVALPVAAIAHPGGLNAEGCHNDRKNGGYHCHRSGNGARGATPNQAPRASSGRSNGRAFTNCAAARAAGAAPVRRGDPGYGPHLDRDNDGIGCE